MNISRLQNELKEMHINSLENVSAGPIGDKLDHWQATIIPPSDSLYSGGIFQLDIRFTGNYPFQPPTIRFVTKIYHPNISSETGAICLDILKDQWSPSLTINKVLLSICSLLTDPNPNDPLNSNAANHFHQNKLSYELTVREWVLKYAN
jgi:ubiquitin-conjugating enzyme E2 D